MKASFTDFIQLLPELENFFPEEAVSNSIFSFFKIIFDEFISLKDSSLSITDYFLGYLVENSSSIFTHSISYFGAFLALWKGNYRYYLILKKLIPKTNINYYSLLSYEILYHILFSGQFDFISELLDSIKIFVEKDHFVRPTEKAQILINYFGVKSYLFQLRGNTLKSRQFFNFAMKELNENRLSYLDQALFIPNILRIYSIIPFNSDQAIQISSDLVTISEQSNNRYLKAFSKLLHAKVLYYLDDELESYKYLNESRKIIQSINSPPLELFLLSQLSELEKNNGRLQKYLDINKQIIFLATYHQLPKMLIIGLKQSADIYFLQYNFQVAEDLYDKAIILAKRTKDFVNKAYCLQQIGSLHLTQQNFIQAHDAFLEALEIIEMFKIDKNSINFELGQLFLYLKDFNNVFMIYQLLRGNIHRLRLQNELIVFKAQIQLINKNYEEARELLEDLYIKQERLKPITTIKINLILLQLDLVNYSTEKDDVILEDAENKLTILLDLSKHVGFSAIEILMIITKALWLYLYKRQKGRIGDITTSLLNNAWELAEKNNYYYLAYLAKRYTRKLSRSSRKISAKDLEEIILFSQRMIMVLVNIKQKRF